MAATKVRDLAVKVSDYTDNQGQQKGRYENIGSLMKGEDGGFFIIMKRTFNPAGVPNPEGRDSIMVGCFELRDQGQGQQQQPQNQQRQAPQQQATGGGGVDPNSDIPFAPMQCLPA